MIINCDNKTMVDVKGIKLLEIQFNFFFFQHYKIDPAQLFKKVSEQLPNQSLYRMVIINCNHSKNKSNNIRSTIYSAQKLIKHFYQSTQIFSYIRS
ncbi:unnamed protein product [Paramecium pentaurelia]|uniref:Uncharacterized protein n=1 Tax=Paramecium pentaurelia TaxID=43138 RepID=A0A8S1YBY8_9CILI|nr:unnamed protein product [Paramecium pentaurelia]